MTENVEDWNSRSFVMTVDARNIGPILRQIRDRCKLKDGDTIRVSVEKISVGKGVKI